MKKRSLKATRFRKAARKRRAELVAAGINAGHSIDEIDGYMAVWDERIAAIQAGMDNGEKEDDSLPTN